MATGQFDPNCIVPVSAAISVSTSAAAIKSSSTLAIKFIISTPSSNTKNVYLGDSNVSAARSIVLAPGTSITFGPEALFEQKRYSFDLARFYLVATAASQVATLITLNKGASGGPF